MRKRERYKHLLNLFANFVMLVAETAMFAFIWYKMYVPELEDKWVITLYVTRQYTV